MTISDKAPYLLGKMSFYSGMPKVSNPYPADSQEHGEWDRGWEQAKEESEEQSEEE